MAIFTTPHIFLWLQVMLTGVTITIHTDKQIQKGSNYVGNTIDINGKRYDAKSGALLGNSPISASASVRQTPARQGRAIDGFVKKSGQQPAKVSVPTQKPTTRATLVIQNKQPGVAMEPIKKRAVQRKPAQKAVVHQPEKAKTLMRHAVKKPQVDMKKAIKTQTASEIAAAPVSELTPQLKKAAHIVDDRRLARAKQSGRSNYVRRFTSLQQNYPASQARATTSATTVAARPAIQTRIAAPVAANEAPQKSQAADLFEAAVANARSHEQPAAKVKRSTRRKLVSITAGIAAFLVLGGFIAYTNISNIEVKLASVRVGFAVQLPSYAPTGYALSGGVQAKSGIAAATYRSGSSSYTLQQQTSDWDSQTLYDNVVALSNSKSQTVSAKGRTVYVYGNKAAWVNGGILYSIKVDGTINNQEIASIASSI